MDQPTNRLYSNSFTLEKLLWLLLAIMALVMRLILPDAAPLSAPEAQEALLAWRAIHGQGAPAESYSPLLLTVNALLFSLTGGSDRSARFWPALCGAALVLTPYLFRRHIGRIGAWVAGLCLTLSSTALFASRQVDGTTASAFGGMLCVGGLFRCLDAEGETERRRWLLLAAGGLALAVTSGSLVYGLLISLGMAALFWGAFEEGRRARELLQSINTHLNLLLLTIVGLGWACATGLGWNLAGLGAAGDLLAGWFARFASPSNHVASPIVLVSLYEPLLVVFGLGGWVWAMWRGHRFGVLLGMWGLAGLVILLIMPGRLPLDILWIVLPLALLTGLAVEHLARGWPVREELAIAVAYALFVLLLWGHALLRLAHYALYGDPADLALLLMTVALQGILAVMFALAADPRLVLQAFSAGSGVMLLLSTVAAGCNLAYARPSDPRELLTHRPTAPEVRDLVHTLRTLSWREARWPTALPVVLEDSDVALLWYLRDFRLADTTAGLLEIPRVVVTATDVPLEAAGALDELPGAVGQDFPLRRTWDMHQAACVWVEWDVGRGGLFGGKQLQCQAAARWALYRMTAPLPVERWAVIWLAD